MTAPLIATDSYYYLEVWIVSSNFTDSSILIYISYEVDLEISNVIIN